MFRLLCCLSAALAAYGATPLFQSSFEKSNQGWTAVRGKATPDSAVLHGGNKSLRLEAAKSGGDAVVRFAPVSLTIGKRYELSGWVRTEDLTVRDRAGRPSPSAPRSPWPPCRSTSTPRRWAARSRGPGCR